MSQTAIIIGSVALMLMLMCCSSSSSAMFMMGGGDDSGGSGSSGSSGSTTPPSGSTADPSGSSGSTADPSGSSGSTADPSGSSGGSSPTEYKYDFILNVPCYHTDRYGVSITDIKIDGVRAKSSELTAHVNPGWATCNSKGGGYECEGNNMGWNDPEPANPESNDLTWTQWTPEEIPVGTKVFTITTSRKVNNIKIDYHRPKYVPGWIIKENGKEVLKEDTNGGDANAPKPKTINYNIP